MKMKVYKAQMITCDVSNSAVEEGDRNTSRSKQRERQIKNKILFNNLWVFDIFLLFPVIRMKYLYDLAKYALIVWGPFKLNNV